MTEVTGVSRVPPSGGGTGTEVALGNHVYGNTRTVARQAGKCARCGRAISDPASLARGVGPVCWRACGGDIFAADLQADQTEWDRREQLLREGGEIDLGVNWRYIDHDPNMALQLPWQLRVSVRFRDGAFEAYGVASWAGQSKEIVFGRSADLRSAYAAAVQAGPASSTAADRCAMPRRR